MDFWEDGDGYDPYTGRWSRPVADEFLAWLNVGSGARWLDVGCGTGALIRYIGDKAVLRVGDACEIPFADADFDMAVSGLVLNFVSDPLTARAWAVSGVSS